MRSLLFLLLVIVVAGCSSKDLGPAITCTDVQVTNGNGECDLTTATVCSDSKFYEINCGDDGTCTCIQDENIIGTPFIASSQSFGYCEGFDISRFHDLAAGCGWNLNTN